MIQKCTMCHLPHPIHECMGAELPLTVAVTNKFSFFIMLLALHGYNVTVHGRAVTVTIKITYIT